MIFKAHLASVLMVLGSGATAAAGDLSLTAPIPDNLTWHGITFYGTFDLAYAYQVHGVPLNGALPSGLEENTILSAKNAGRSISSVTESGLEQNRAGIRLEEPIAAGWTALAKLETGFQPLSGELASNCASVARNNGIPLAAQTSYFPGSFCGQSINGPGYAGVSSPVYGTLTAGGRLSLGLDATASYDPLGLAPGFSFVGAAAGAPPSFGNAEDARWNNSVKYIYQLGPVHAAAMYSNGGSGTAMFGGGYGFDAGVAWRGFSMDAVYTVQKSAIATSPIPYATSGAPGTCNAAGTGGNVARGQFLQRHGYRRRRLGGDGKVCI